MNIRVLLLVALICLIVLIGCSEKKTGKVGSEMTHSPRPIGILEGHEGIVFSLAFSPNDDYLASGGGDSTVRIWDVAKQSRIISINGRFDQVYATVFSPDGRFLISGSWDSTIRFWEVPSWEERKSISSKDGLGIICLSISPDGNTLASGTIGTTGDIALWSLKSFRVIATLSGHKYTVSEIAFSPDGQLLATASHDGSVGIWDLKTRRILHICRARNQLVEHVAFSPNGKILVIGTSGGEIMAWDTHTGKKLADVMGHNGGVNCLAITPNCQYLLVGYGEGFHTPGKIAIRSMRNFNLVTTILAHKEGVIRCMVISSNGKILATGSEDYTIRLWNLNALLPANNHD